MGMTWVISMMFEIKCWLGLCYTWIFFPLNWLRIRVWKTGMIEENSLTSITSFPYTIPPTQSTHIVTVTVPAILCTLSSILSIFKLLHCTALHTHTHFCCKRTVKSSQSWEFEMIERLTERDILFLQSLETNVTVLPYFKKKLFCYSFELSRHVQLGVENHICGRGETK